jgi:hypothetical protein
MRLHEFTGTLDSLITPLSSEDLVCQRTRPFLCPCKTFLALTDILNLLTKGHQLDQKLEDLTTERMEKRQKIIIDVDDPSNSFRTPM